jgi:hypothetical protein
MSEIQIIMAEDMFRRGAASLSAGAISVLKQLV